jgi:hypothetical protein
MVSEWEGEPFAGHSERSEEPAFADAQGKLRDEGPVFSDFLTPDFFFLKKSV